MSDSPEVLAIIPARDGSKGLPGKNVRELGGQPLLAWAVQSANRSETVTRVLLSTNSIEYADIGKRYGADVPFIRPQKFASDSAVDIEVMTHAVDWLKEEEGYIPDFVLRLQPTNPTFPTTKIDEGVRLLIENTEADSVRAVTPTPKTPYKMWVYANDGVSIKPLMSGQPSERSESFNMGREQLPQVFVQVGALEVLRYATLTEKKSMAGEKVLPLVIDNPWHTINIDTEIDFRLAEIAVGEDIT